MRYILIFIKYGIFFSSYFIVIIKASNVNDTGAEVDLIPKTNAVGSQLCLIETIKLMQNL